MLYDVIYHPFPINFQYVGVDSPAHIGILTGERPRFKRRTSHVPNLMHKLLKFIFTGNHCRPLNIVKMNGIQPGGGGAWGHDSNTPGTFFVHLWSTDIWNHIRLQSCGSVLARSTKMDARCYLVSILLGWSVVNRRILYFTVNFYICGARWVQTVFPDFNLVSVFIGKNIFIMENLTDFGKNWWQRGCTYHVSR